MDELVADLKIGVTGHRILTDLDEIREGIVRALCEIARAYPGRPWIVVSPLAEGADRMVAREVLRRSGSKLTVPLPLPEDKYMQDFRSPESRIEFQVLLRMANDVVTIPDARNRREAYRAIGRYVVDHCDVLVAVWDGHMKGESVGTADAIRYARLKAIPLVIVRAGNRKPGTKQSTSLAAEQGKVISERLPRG